MSDLTGTNAAWAAVVILVIPAAIIAAAELDERLRQRESPLRRAVQILRTWVLPLFALWAILVPVLAVDTESIPVRLVATALVVAVTATTVSLLNVVLAGVQRRSADDDRRAVPQLILALPRIGVYLVAGWVLLAGVHGIDLSAALTALGVTSLVVSFALQDTLSGLASGVLIISDQPFQPGDWITIGEGEGAMEAKVLDLNWRTTRVQDRNGDVIIVPNSQLAGAPIVNHTSPDTLHRVVVELQVAYLNPPTLAKAMLIDAAEGTPGVRAEPPPRVRVVTIDDPLMTYQVDMWIDDFTIEPMVRSDFGSLVWYQSNRHGVPLPSPAQDLYLYDGDAVNAAQIPTLGEVRERLARSPVLASLPDSDLDRLAAAARPARFAVGELLIDADDPSRDLLVIVEGRVEFLLAAAGRSLVTGEAGEGEIVGLDRSTRSDRHGVSVRALTDCEVVIADGEVAGEIASRDADVSATLNRISSIRRRRRERVLEYRSLGGPDPTEEPSA